MLLKGKVVSGLGRGSFFLSLFGYKEQFKSKLDIEPVEGTMNIELDEESAKRYQELTRSNDCVILEPFIEQGKEYGRVRVFPANIEDVRCYLVIPEKSSYHDVAEIISDKNLRDELGLQDGHLVELMIQNSFST